MTGAVGAGTVPTAKVPGTGPAARTPEDAAVSALRDTTAVRTRAGVLLNRARAGESPWFTVDDDALRAAAGLVAETTVRRHPDLAVPYHSRWRHFEAGGVDRRARLLDLLADGSADATERARATIDLTVVSVLLDAGAGPAWHFIEPGAGDEPGGGRYARSEGLGVASWHAFVGGAFSGDPHQPLRVDAAGLRALTSPTLAAAFQVGDDNPLVGLDGRVAVLRRLGAALAARPDVFGPDGRPGGLYDAAAARPGGPAAHDLLVTLLDSFAPIWPADNAIGGIALGDCWRHRSVPGPGASAGWMPLHKLSQWLTYSLLEPFEWAGATVTGIDDLTGLPEYRNGGLLLDTGALRLRDPRWAERTWQAGDELVVEWRALTVALLDELAPLVRDELDVDAAALPLARVLEGGTWAAGRELAAARRAGLPPLAVASDGTVF